MSKNEIEILEKTCNTCGETKLIEEFRIHNGYRRHGCKACAGVKGRKYREENKELLCAKQKIKYQENKEERCVYSRRYSEKNRDEVNRKKRVAHTKNRDVNNEKRRQWWRDLSPERKDEQRAKNKKHREENKEYRNAQNKIWYNNNKDYKNARDAKRRAAKRNALPPWLNSEHDIQIKQFYTQSQRLTEDTGVQHNVDHIVPLQGVHVCGLHVPWNLDVMTAVENSSKGNRYTGDDAWE